MSLKPENSLSYQHFDYTPASGALGAIISGIQLNGDIPKEVLAELKQALLDFKVLFFRDQHMNEDGHAAFANLVGTPADADFIPSLEGYPMITSQRYDEHSRMGSDVSFHADDSFHKFPTKMSILRGVEMPSNGGDTIWVDMEKVYNSLSPTFKNMLDGLTAEHSLLQGFSELAYEEGGVDNLKSMMERNPPHTHPLVIRHPETGAKSLYLSELLTLRIKEMEKDESDLLLKYLSEKAYNPQFACRFKWENGSVAWWDNRNTVHRGIDDFYPSVRVMHRIAIADEQRPAYNLEEAVKRDISYLSLVPCNSLNDDKQVSEKSTSETDQVSQPQQQGTEAVDVDPKFLEKLNKKKEGFTFTPQAAMQIKKIPMIFRGAALSAIFSEAENQGVTHIGLEVLDVVKAKR